MIEHTLRNLGYECLLASDGEEAVKISSETTPDLILLDINMPNMDGIIVLQKIRFSPKLRSVPIIMISTLMENETVIECLLAGADDYVTKPFVRTVLYGHKILSKIPRLERVAEIIRYSFKNYDGSGAPEEKRFGREMKLIGSRILRAVWEYELLFIKHENPEETVGAI